MAEYTASKTRYTETEGTDFYRHCGKSGLMLPPIALGLWHNFGSVDNYENMKQMCFTAFDHGITHFDLANNYGPVYGSAEENFGRILREEMSAYRDEMVISTKAGYDMWQRGQPQIPDRESGSELKENGTSICRYLLSSSHGSEHTVRRDDGSTCTDCKKW